MPCRGSWPWLRETAIYARLAPAQDNATRLAPDDAAPILRAHPQ